MSIRMHNRKASGSKDSIPVSFAQSFRDYWEPGAKALGLELVPMLHVLVINEKNKNTEKIFQLIDELKKLRGWFKQNAPKNEQEYLLGRVEALIDELTTISKDSVIDIDFG